MRRNILSIVVSIICIFVGTYSYAWSQGQLLTTGFWESAPSDTQVVQAIFGTTTNPITEYTKYRTGNNCVNQSISVVQVQPTDTIPTLLQTNTVYILNSGSYQVNQMHTFSGSCTALIASGTVQLRSTLKTPQNNTNYFAPILFMLTGSNHIVIDNITIYQDDIFLHLVFHMLGTQNVSFMRTNVDGLNRVESVLWMNNNNSYFSWRHSTIQHIGTYSGSLNANVSTYTGTLYQTGYKSFFVIQGANLRFEHLKFNRLGAIQYDQDTQTHLQRTDGIGDHRLRIGSPFYLQNVSDSFFDHLIIQDVPGGVSDNNWSRPVWFGVNGMARNTLNNIQRIRNGGPMIMHGGGTSFNNFLAVNNNATVLRSDIPQNNQIFNNIVVINQLGVPFSNLSGHFNDIYMFNSPTTVFNGGNIRYFGRLVVDENRYVLSDGPDILPINQTTNSFVAGSNGEGGIIAGLNLTQGVLTTGYFDFGCSDTLSLYDARALQTVGHYHFGSDCKTVGIFNMVNTSSGGSVLSTLNKNFGYRMINQKNPLVWSSAVNKFVYRDEAYNPLLKVGDFHDQIMFTGIQYIVAGNIALKDGSDQPLINNETTSNQVKFDIFFNTSGTVYISGDVQSLQTSTLSANQTGTLTVTLSGSAGSIKNVVVWLQADDGTLSQRYLVAIKHLNSTPDPLLVQYFSGSNEYTERWLRNECDPRLMKIEHIVSGAPLRTYNANTLYVYHSGTYTFASRSNPTLPAGENNVMEIQGNCVGIIGSGNVILSGLYGFSSDSFSTRDKFVSMIGKRNIIIDNLDIRFQRWYGVGIGVGIRPRLSNSFTISNTKITQDGSLGHTNGVWWQAGIYPSSSSRGVYRGLIVSRLGVGFYLQGRQTRQYIFNSRFFSSVSHGIQVFGGPLNNSIINNVDTYNNGSHGLVIDGGNNSLLNNIKAYNNVSHGIVLRYGDNYGPFPVRNVVVSNSALFNNQGRGFVVEGGPQPVTNLQSVLLTNSIIYNNFSNGILIGGFESTNNTGVYIHDVTVFNNGSNGIHNFWTGTKIYGKLKFFNNSNPFPTTDIIGTQPFLGSTGDGLGLPGGSIDTSMTVDNCSRKINPSTIPLGQECKTIGRVTAGISLPSIMTYSYGQFVPKQTPDYRWQNNTLVLGNQLNSRYLSTGLFIGEHGFQSGFLQDNITKLVGEVFVVSGSNRVNRTLGQAITGNITSSQNAQYTIYGDFNGSPITGNIVAGQLLQIPINLTSEIGNKTIKMFLSNQNQTSEIYDAQTYYEQIVDPLYMQYFGLENARTRYTKERGSNNCNPNAFNPVVYINPGDTIPSVLNKETLYVINSGTYAVTGIVFNGSCIGLVGSGNVTLVGGNNNASHPAMLFAEGKSNLIIANLNIKLTQGCHAIKFFTANISSSIHDISVNGHGCTDTTAHLGQIDLGNTKTNSIRNIVLSGGLSAGLSLKGSNLGDVDENFITNLEVIGQGRDGIYLYNARNNVFNYLKTYNNGSNGIKIDQSLYNAFNNFQIFNNTNNGVSLREGQLLGSSANSLYNTFSNGVVMRNGLRGVYIGDGVGGVFDGNNPFLRTSDSRFQYLHNMVVTNNRGGVYVGGRDTHLSDLTIAYNTKGLEISPGVTDTSSRYYGKFVITHNGINIFGDSSRIIPGSVNSTLGFGAGQLVVEDGRLMRCSSSVKVIGMDYGTDCTRAHRSTFQSITLPQGYQYGGLLPYQKPALRRKSTDGLVAASQLLMPISSQMLISERNKDMVSYEMDFINYTGVLAGSIQFATDYASGFTNNDQITVTLKANSYPINYILTGDIIPSSTNGTLVQDTDITLTLTASPGLKNMSVVFSSGDKKSEQYILQAGRLGTAPSQAVNYFSGTTGLSQNRTNNICIPQLMSIQNVTTSTLPSLLTGNTVYILSAGTYSLPRQLDLNGSCIALVANGAVKMISPSVLNVTNLPANRSMISVDGLQNIIIEGVEINGWSGSSSNKASRNNYGIAITRSANTTISKTKVGHHTLAGIFFDRGYANMVIDSDVYGATPSNAYGIDISNQEKFLSFNNRIYNNRGGLRYNIPSAYQLYSNHTSGNANSRIDRNQIFSNSSIGVSINHAGLNFLLQNSQIFANGGDGIVLSDSYSRGLMLNNLMVYNNNGRGIDNQIDGRFTNSSSTEEVSSSLINSQIFNNNNGVRLRFGIVGSNNFQNTQNILVGNSIYSNAGHGLFFHHPNPTLSDLNVNNFNTTLRVDLINNAIYHNTTGIGITSNIHRLLPDPSSRVRYYGYLDLFANDSNISLTTSGVSTSISLATTITPQSGTTYGGVNRGTPALNIGTRTFNCSLVTTIAPTKLMSGYKDCTDLFRGRKIGWTPVLDNINYVFGTNIAKHSSPVVKNGSNPAYKPTQPFSTGIFYNGQIDFFNDLAIDITKNMTGNIYGLQDVVYQISYSNNGQYDVTGASIVLALPIQIGYYQHSPGSFTTQVSSDLSTVTFSNLDIQKFSTGIIVVTGRAKTGFIDNTPLFTYVSISPITGELSTANNIDVTPFGSTPDFWWRTASDLSLSKVADKTGIVVGEKITYTITLTNNGPEMASGTKIVDYLPAALQFVESSINTGNGFVTNNGTVVSTGREYLLGNLAVGQQATLVLTASMKNGYLDGFIFANTGSASSALLDLMTGNNTDAVTGVLLPSADLRIQQNVAGRFFPGENLTYTLTYTNDGPSPIQDIVVIALLSTGQQLISTSKPYKSLITTETGIQLIFTGQSLASGQSDSIVFTATILNQLDNVFSFSSTGIALYTGVDANLANNISFVSNPLEAYGDVSIEIDIIGGAPLPNNPLVYEIKRFNAGPDTAGGMVLTSKLGQQISFGQSSITLSAADPTNKIYTFTLPSLPAGKSGSLILTAIVDAGYDNIAPIELTGSIIWSQDTNQSNNTALHIRSGIDPLIVKYFYSPLSQYNTYWTNKQCNIFAIDVVHVNNIDDLPAVLSGNTIYSIDVPNLTLPTQRTFGGDCIVVRGTGEYYTTLQGPSGTPWLRVDNRKKIIVDNLVVPLNGSASPFFTAFSGVHITLSDLRVSGGTGNGVSINDNSRNVIIQNSQFYSNKVGVAFNPGGGNHLITNTHFYNNTSDGLKILGNEHIVTHNIMAFNNFDHGIEISNSQYLAFNNIQSYNNDKDGFNISNTVGLSINNVQLYNNKEDGLYMTNTQKVVLNETDIYNNQDAISGATPTNTFWYGKNTIFGNGTNSDGGISTGSATDTYVAPVNYLNGQLTISNNTITCPWTTEPYVGYYDNTILCNQRGAKLMTSPLILPQDNKYGCFTRKQVIPTRWNASETTLQFFGL